MADHHLLSVHSGFLESLAALDKSDQKRVRATIKQLTSEGLTGGTRQHKVGLFVSLSSSMDLRIIAARQGGRLVLLHVNHHDDAYDWAERRTATIDDHGTLLAVTPHNQERDPTADVTTTLSPSRFSALPGPIASMLEDAHHDEGAFLEVVSCLSPEYQEIALAASIDLQTDMGPSDVIVVDDEVLEFALQYPEHRWRVFLHPQQRHVVDRPVEGHLLLRGGPGTGKTICLVHRFVKLAKTYSPPPLLVVLNQAAEEAIRESCELLGQPPSTDSICSVRDLPTDRDELAQFLRPYASVLIDESQDLPIDLVRPFLELLERGAELPPLFIAYDPNQAISQPSGNALRRLEEFCDTVTLNYCYRSTSQIIDTAHDLLARLHNDYAGKDYENEQHIEASREIATAGAVAALLGPEVTVIEASPRSLISNAVDACRRLAAETDEVLSAILVCDSPREFLVAKDELQSEFPEANVYAPRDCKGLEFRRGLVVDLVSHETIRADSVVHSRYQLLLGLYVGITRFRDSLTCVVTSNSPLYRDRLESDRE